MSDEDQAVPSPNVVGGEGINIENGTVSKLPKVAMKAERGEPTRSGLRRCQTLSA